MKFFAIIEVMQSIANFRQRLVLFLIICLLPNLCLAAVEADKLLWTAIQKNDQALLESALKKGAYIDAPNPQEEKKSDALHHRSSPLTVCILDKKTALADYLIKNGANLLHKNPRGISPLIASVYSGQNELMNKLVQLGVSVHQNQIQTRDGTVLSLLYFAVLGSNLQLVNDLLKDQPGKANENEMMFLYTAIDGLNQSLTIFNTLRQHQYGPKTLGPERITQLRRAAFHYGKPELIKDIYQKKQFNAGENWPEFLAYSIEQNDAAFANVIINDYRDALKAQKWNNLRVPRNPSNDLLEIVKTHFPVTVLMDYYQEKIQKITQEQNLSAVKTFFRLPAIASIKDYLLRHAYINAINNDKLDIAYWSLTQGSFDPLVEGRLNINPIIVAMDQRHLPLTRALLKRGIRPDVTYGSDQQSLLHLACERNLPSLVAPLLKLGIKVDVENRRRQTPVYCAVKTGNMKLLKLLIKHKANLDAYYSENLMSDSKTLLHIALEEKHFAIFTLLSKKIKINQELANSLMKTAISAKGVYGVKFIARYIKDINQATIEYNFNRFSPMEWSLIDGDLNTTRSLLQLGARLTPAKENHYLVCHQIETENLETLSFLQKRGFPLNIDCNQLPSIHFAVVNDKRQAIRYLVKNGIDINSVVPPFQEYAGLTAYSLAKVLENKALLAFLRKMGGSAISKSTDNSDPGNMVVSLATAIDRGDSTAVIKLALSGGDINSANISGTTALMHTVYKNNPSMQQLMLKLGADPKLEDKEGETAYSIAESNSFMSSISLLLPFATQADRDRALRNSAAAKHLDTARRLLSKYTFSSAALNLALLKTIEADSSGAIVSNLDAKQKEANTLPLLDNLLRAGANANTPDHPYSPMALLASRYQDKENIILAKRLLQAKANLERKDAKGDTPAGVAAERGHCAFLQFILSQGANANHRNLKKETPLILNLRDNDHKVPCVDALIQAGADVNAQDKYGQTPLYMLARKWQSDLIPIAELLKKKNVKIDVADSSGNTPLIEACDSSRNGEMVRWLLDNGADINKRNDYKQTPLMIAAAGAYEEVINPLLQHNPDLDAQDKKGDTALHYALDDRQYTLPILLKTKININLANYKGETPLHKAVKNGYDRDTALLLRHKANACLKDKQGQTPLALARAGKNKDIKKLFEKVACP